MIFDKTKLPDEKQILTGRKESIKIIKPHYVLKIPLSPTPQNGYEVMMVGMGCFWGAEKKFWQIKGVYSTMVGYAGGKTPNPKYEEVCTGKTGHIEVVRIIYDPKQISFSKLLTVFWQGHNATQGMRQGGDIGTQYRSAIFYFKDSELQEINKSIDQFLKQQQELTGKKLEITTELIKAGMFYFAEDYHQQYLAKNR